MNIKQTTPDQAFETLKSEPDSIYLDVRSVTEFEAEHPEGSINIPIMHKTSVGMNPNQEFLTVAEASLPKDKKILVGCLRGGRSQKACELLFQHGYTNLENIQGGFGGAIDPATGLVSQKGWKDLGLPTSQKAKEDETYAGLEAKAKQSFL